MSGIALLAGMPWGAAALLAALMILGWVLVYSNVVDAMASHFKLKLMLEYQARADERATDDGDGLDRRPARRWTPWQRRWRPW